MEWCEELYSGVNLENILRRSGRASAVAVAFCMLIGAVYDGPYEKIADDFFLPGGGEISAWNWTVPESCFRDVEVSPTVTKAASELLDVPVSEAAVLPDTGADIPLNVPEGSGTDVISGVPDESGTGLAGPVLPDVPGDGASDLPGDTASDISGGVIPGVPDDMVPDLPAENPGDTVPDIPADVSDEGTAGEEEGDSVSDPAGAAEETVGGFLVSESGMICGIADAETAVTDGYMELPSEGCSGIARGAFADAPAGILEVYIPENITYAEPGAFLGLHEVLWFGSGAEDGNLFASDGVLYSENGACLLAFPAGRVGFFLLPSHVLRLEDDAFAGAMLQKVDARKGNVTDIGNLPEDKILL